MGGAQASTPPIVSVEGRQKVESIFSHSGDGRRHNCPKTGPDVSGLLILKGKYWERMEEEYSLGDPEGLSLQISSALLTSPD